MEYIDGVSDLNLTSEMYERAAEDPLNKLAVESKGM
jgi:hypothetical protein